tara:strand:+ start:17303 stop:17428 length:126 start_codon:yes stop_codon:yes gene_type:complete
MYGTFGSFEEEELAPDGLFFWKITTMFFPRVHETPYIVGAA